MGPISANIPLFRGTVLREKGANEFSGVGARELLMYIKYGMFDKAMGKKIQWSDLQSFSSNPNIASYSKFIESWTNPSNTNSKKAADRQLASMEMLPVIFRLASAQGQTGFNISDKALVQEVMGKPVNEKEWVLNKPSGTITGIRQDMGTRNYIVDLMQNGGRVQSAESGWTQKETEKAYSQYTDTELQSRKFEGFGRGRSNKRRPNPDDEIWGSNPLNTAFHVLLPNAVGRSEEEKTQLNILRRYMSMFNITDPNQLNAGMQASLMEMFMIHGGNMELGINPSLIQPMGEYDTGSAQVEGPGTYFSSNLKTHDETWDDFAGGYKYTISKTREAFRKVARGKGYIQAYDEDTDFHEPSKQLRGIVNSFSRTKSGKEAIETDYFIKNHWLRDVQFAAENSGPGSPFYKYLVEQGYQGIQWAPATLTNFNIGREGISLSPISNPPVYSLYDNDIEEYVDLKKPFPANIPNLSPVGYQSGGRVNGYADESKELAEWTSGGMKGVRGNLYKYQALTNQASSIPAGIRLGRGTVLNPGLSKELSAEQQMMLLAAIQSGDYSSVIGKELSFRGLNSFSESSIGAKYSPANNYPISRFMQNALAPYSAVGQSGSLAKAIASGLKVGPAGYSGAFFDFTTGKNTKGINAGLRSVNQLQETILSSPSGRITGVSSDTATKKPIFHIQGYKSGGRIKSAASGMAFAHIVPPVSLGSNIAQTYPLGLDVPFALNSGLNGKGYQLQLLKCQDCLILLERKIQDLELMHQLQSKFSLLQ